ncbi:MAG: phosphatase PAP2 family protein [bacterium]
MDLLIFQKLNSFVGQSVCLDSLFIFFAKDLGCILVVILFLFLLKNFKKYWLMAVSGFMAAILARFGIVELVRFFWERPRPFIENNVNLLLEHEATSSFPSGHAAFFFALSFAVYAYNKKTGLLFFLASFLISVSRVFAGLHWPSDIIAGALVGIISGWLVIRVFKKT